MMESEKKKIAIFVDQWFVGGKESYLIGHLSLMDLSQLSITILTSHKKTTFYDDTIRQLGIKFVELTYKAYGPFTRNYHVKKQLKIYLHSHDFDIFHANLDNGVVLSYTKIARKCGIQRVIAHSHNSNIGGGITRPIKLIGHYLGKRKYMKYPTEFWACSDYAAKWLFSAEVFEKGEWTFVKNGIDFSKARFNAEYRADIRKKYELKNSFVIGSIGRLSQQKNYSFLIEVIAQVYKLNPSAKLLLIGEGSKKEQLVREAQRLGIESTVIFYGTTNNISEVLSAMDCFVLTSKFEGFPLSGIEAQINGIPCVFSDRITKQSNLSGKLNFCSISNKENWVEALSRKLERYEASFDDKGFDIVQSSRQLRDYYLSE